MPRDQILQSHGATVLTPEGDKIGTIDEIYQDRETRQPQWMLVNTGLFGTRSNFVPLANASIHGNDIVVPFSKSQVTGAPKIEPNGQLSQREEAELYRHYSLNYQEIRSGTGPQEGTSGGTRSDDAMTRSEEELRVGKKVEQSGVVRLKKHVVTERVEKTIPIEREEVRVEREPVTDANVGEATTGPDFTESEYEVALKEERPVVEKHTVPKERVRLIKDKVTDEARIVDEVRKERIEEERDTHR
jgi:uncharacterized protein (TIGR02271 family)